jgi:hypothetical protein
MKGDELNGKDKMEIDASKSEIEGFRSERKEEEKYLEYESDLPYHMGECVDVLDTYKHWLNGEIVTVE